MKKTIAAILLFFTLVCASTPVFASEREMNIAADIAVVRPLSLAATILGTVGFIIALPFSIPSGSVHKTAKVLVSEPFHYTFSRPVGDFERSCAE